MNELNYCINYTLDNGYHSVKEIDGIAKEGLEGGFIDIYEAIDIYWVIENNQFNEDISVDSWNITKLKKEGVENKRIKIIVSKPTGNGTYKQDDIKEYIGMEFDVINWWKNKDSGLNKGEIQVVLKNEKDKNLLNKAYNKIDEEMKKVGFINDSDNTDRFLDNLANEINEDEQEEILEDLKIYVNDKYNCLCEVDESGNAEVYFYSKDFDFNSIKGFYEHFNLGEY